MKNFSFIVIILAILTSCRPTYKATNMIFHDLPNGALLVRLKTNHNTIKALEERNSKLQKQLEAQPNNSSQLKEDIKRREKLILKIKTNRDENNQNIIDAFEYFTYCPVYFFYSTDSKKVFDKQFDNILLNKDLIKIQPTPELNNNYLIAEFGQTTEDTIKYVYGHDSHSNLYYHGVDTYNNVNEDSLKDEHRYMGTDKSGNTHYSYNNSYGTSMEGGVDALVLLSPEFVQLQAPYPHYVRTFQGFPIKRKKERSVEILQKRIEKFIEKQ